MRKKELVSKVKSLKFEKGTYIVFGSGPFAALGIREVNDIDLYVSKELYEELEGKGWKKIYKGPKDEPLVYEDFEAHNTWDFSSYSPLLRELISRAFYVEDVPFASLEDVRLWKEASKRPKDYVDLKLIDEYLKSRSSE